VLAVGLTGGIGAGKSALADLYVERGAALVDSDVIAREVVATGSPTLEELVEHFGATILAEDRSLDRQELARLAFVSPEQVELLNSIVHPAIRGEMMAQREAAREREGVCIFAIPLLTKDHSNALELHKIVVVDCPIDVAIERLTEYRGFDAADAAARVAAQMTREERRELADYVLLNDRDLAALTEQAELLWERLLEDAGSLG
jgi:dephospho-CoA kinase